MNEIIWVWEEDVTISHLRSTYVTFWSKDKPEESIWILNLRKAYIREGYVDD